MKVIACEKTCKECGFIKDGTKDTLYAEAFEIIENGIIFPCHMYLKSKTGSESHGTSSLDTIKVCRGFVNYMFVNQMHFGMYNETWRGLMLEVFNDNRDNLYTKDELLANHIGLRDNIYLGNQDEQIKNS